MQHSCRDPRNFKNRFWKKRGFLQCPGCLGAGAGGDRASPYACMTASSYMSIVNIVQCDSRPISREQLTFLEWDASLSDDNYRKVLPVKGYSSFS
mmetsp:Transcript_14703/g.31423  ORF Transcript_14703/g.31423 Transcript_14703/m.31423 type:complete len:95 (-) Transcript_14703:509-793(-)